MAVKKNDKIKKDCKSIRKGRRAVFFLLKRQLFLFDFPSGIVNFASKASKRREGIHFFISSDKYLILISPIVGYADTFSEEESKKKSDIF